MTWPVNGCGHRRDLWFDNLSSVANGLVYVGSTLECDLDPNLYAFDAAGVSMLGRHLLPGLEHDSESRWASSSPIVANGVVYAGASALHAYTLP